MTAPYMYDDFLSLGPDDGPTYVCRRCESTFEVDHYICPVCGTFTIERRGPTPP
ncbi:MAG: hypothetical protein ABEJ82_09515 [Haloplanus sp.]